MFEQAAGSAFGTFRTCRDFQIEFSGVKRKLDLGFAMGRLWREAVIGSVAYQNASVLPAEERLSPRKNNIEIQHAVAGSIFRWNRLCD